MIQGYDWDIIDTYAAQSMCPYETVSNKPIARRRRKKKKGGGGLIRVICPKLPQFARLTRTT